MDAYVQALRQAIKPDSVVLDIGTGTGVFALLACQFGATRVYAIEPNDAILMAQEIAKVNGYAERIRFIQDVSTQVVLDEQADIIISDLRGTLPLLHHHIPSIIDARKRLLAPGGVLIPRSDALWVAVAEAPDLYHKHVAPWENGDYDLDMETARKMVLNNWRKSRVEPEQLLVNPRCWATLDYATIENPSVNGEETWTAERAGTAHGLSIWFDATIAEGVCFSNAPDAPKLIYSSAFFPWSEPVNIAVGDTVTIALRANLVGKDYVWRWDTCVLDEGVPERVKAQFQQSTFFGKPLSPEQLRKRAVDYMPVLGSKGQVDRFILELMNGESTTADIAHRVLTQFPDRFPDRQAATEHVRDLSEKYSR